MIGCLLLTYVNGILIEKYKNKIHYILSLVICLTPLIIFKYVDFFISNINKISNLDIKLLKLVLPLGISFYTFQMLTYLIDIKKERIKSEKNFLNLSLYICFFPQLVAGPIVKYSEMKDQIHKRKITLEGVGNGILLFCIGLGKKVLIANQLGELCNLYQSDNATIIFTWIYMISYSLQVYFDFSGYSTMAIGLGKMFGFELPINFNYPFICKNIKDFWKRWHITLSSFFKDYIYIPLGGSRKGTLRTILNLSIVWFLTGFWHGADWNFILWGLYFFILLVIEKYIIKDRLPKVLQQIMTVILIGISFVIFSSSSMGEIFITLKNLISGKIIDSNTLFVIRNNIVLIVIGIIGATPFIRDLYVKYVKNSKISCVLEPLIVVTLLVLSTAYLIDGSFNPFLYFRF